MTPGRYNRVHYYVYTHVFYMKRSGKPRPRRSVNVATGNAGRRGLDLFFGILQKRVSADEIEFLIFNEIFS